MPKVVNYFESDNEDKDEKFAKYDKSIIKVQRAQLPMYQGRREVVDEILRHKVTIIVGETGSGKSTQLPQALLESDHNQNIVVTQPRRVAARSLAHRVANEMGTKVGHKVGYNVRFDSKISKHTRIRYVTDGMLLREFMLDPMLKKYTTIIVDEAHERTVTSDLVLGLLNRLRNHSSRSSLRIVVMSATIDTQRFADFFGANETSKLYVPGRAYPVDRFYVREPVAHVVDAAAQAVIQVNRGEPGGGGILVFLPGQDEIESVAEILRNVENEKGVPEMRVLPLYASLPEREQQLAFANVAAGTRKVVLATNIAETSVTIPGVRYVIDSGLRKVRVHRSALGLESLLPAPISKASATQRMGRAGREGPGKCWRLYTESTYVEEMVPQTEPEISRVSLAFPILLLKRIGVDDVVNFPWVDSPSKVAVRNALLQLFSLKAIDNSGKITPFGIKMSTLPLEPQLAAVLIGVNSGYSPKIRKATIDVVACLSVQDLLLSPSPARRQQVADRRHELFPASVRYGDLILVKLIWDAHKEIDAKELKEWCNSIGVSLRALRKVEQVRRQLTSYLIDAGTTISTEKSDRAYADASGHSDSDDSDDEKFESEDYDQLIKAFLSGFVTNTALALPDRRFQTLMTQQVINIHPGSALFGSKPEAIMYLEYVYTIRGYARIVSPIEINWLKEISPHLLARSGEMNA